MIKYSKIIIGCYAFISLLASSQVATAEPQTVTLEQFNQLKARMDEAELRDSLKTFLWSGVLINRYESFYSKDVPPTGATSSNYINGWSTAMELNVDSKLNQKVAFYGSIGMSKLWNNSGRIEGGPYWSNTAGNNGWGFSQSQTGSYGLGGPGAFIDRAYMSYKFDIPLTFSIGRLPTNGGPPIEQLDGLDQQGTYPRFSYNAIFDGMALSYDFSGALPSNQSLRLTAFYTPFVNIDNTTRTLQSQTPSGTKINSTNDQFTLLLNYELRNTAIARKIILDYFYYEYDNWFGYDPNPDANPNVSSPNADGAAGGYSGAKANMFYAGFTGIADTGISASFSTLSVASTEQGANFLANSNAYFGTLSYEVARVKNLWVGWEYISTDPDFYLDEWTRLELIPFYSLCADRGFHLYATKGLGNGMTLRVGYYQTVAASYNTTFSGYSDGFNMSSSYANFRFDF